MKRCVKCGCELPDEAEFCPNCAASQTEKREIKAPRPWKRKAAVAAAVALVVIAAVAAALLYHAPRTYTGGSSLTYADGGEEYLLLLSYDQNGKNREPRDEAKIFLAVEERAQKPSQFFVYPADGSDRDVKSTFMDKVSSVEVRAEELNRNKCVVDEPHWDADFPLAAQVAFLRPDSLTGDNDIIWTFHMKNGDTIELRHRLLVEVTQTREYRSEVYAMNTATELQALADRIEAESGEYDVIYLYLPAVTYTEFVTLRNRAYRLVGAEGETRTAFAATVSYSTTLETITEFYDVDFLGSGTGTGIAGEGFVMLYGCTVRGWETGVLGHRNAAAQDSLFEDNGTAILIDADGFVYSEGEMFRNTFRNNGVAFHLAQLPTEYPFVFDGCVFSGNGEDVVNETIHPIDVSGAERS